MNIDMRNTTATLPEIVFENLRKINGLKNIGPENCCECISFCEDTIKYLAKMEEVSQSDENQDYEVLEDQIINLCTHGTQLKDSTLTCLLRDKYLPEKN